MNQIATYNQIDAQWESYNQRASEILVADKPAGIPVFDDTDAEPVRINFLSHTLSSSLIPVL